MKGYADDIGHPPMNQIDDFGEHDNDDRFFDSGSLVPASPESDLTTPMKRYTLNGFIREDASYSYALPSPYLSMLKTTLNMQFETKIGDTLRIHAGGNVFYDASFRIKGRNSFSKETRDELESETELRDTFVEGRLFPGLYIKAGKQVAAWGESDFFRINDRVNPRDQREPGMVELEDARIPVFSTGMTYAQDALSLSVIAVHEASQDKLAPSGSDFDYFKSLRSDSVVVNDTDDLDVSFQNSEYHVKLTGYFNGGDMSVYTSRAYDDLPYNEYVRFDPLSGRLFLTPYYKKITSSGMAANLARNNFLFKYEAAYIKDSAVQRNDVMDQIARSPFSPARTWSEQDTFRVMAGFDYSGVPDLLITVEGYNEHILGYNPHLLPDKDTGTVYASARYETLNATLDYTINAIYMIKTKDSIIKLMANYEIFDGLSIDGGIIFYTMTDPQSPYYPYRKNDRIFTGVKYSF